jgi:hypothetical protein
MAKEQSYDFSSFDNAVKEYDTSVFDMENEESVTSPEVSQTESAARGLASGASLGFSDELAGAAEAAISAVKENDYDLSSLIEKYKKERDESRKLNKLAEEANPLTYLGANIAGGFALPAGMYGNLAKGASALAKTGAGALSGLVGGGLAGLGSSEASTVGGDITATAESAGMGAILGGVLAGVPAAVSSSLKESKLGKKALNVFEKSSKGEDVFSPEKASKFTEEGMDVIRDLVNKVDEVKKSSGKIMSEAIESAPVVKTSSSGMYSSGVSEPVAAIKSSETLLSDVEPSSTIKEFKNIINKAYNFDPKTNTQHDYNLKDLQLAKNEIGDIVFKGKSLEPQEQRVGRELYNQLKTDIVSNLDDVAKQKYQIGEQGYAKSIDTQSKLGGLTSRVPTDVNERAAYQSKINELTNDLTKAFNNPLDVSSVNLMASLKNTKTLIDDIDTKLSKLVPSSEEAQSLLTKKQAKLDEMDKLTDKVKKSGLDIQTFTDLYGKKGASSHIPGHGVINVINAATSTPIYGVAKAAGSTVKVASDAAKRLYDLTPDGLADVIQKLSSKKSPFVGQLTRIAQEPLRTRKAMLYSLMQQPGFRQEISDSGEGNE